MPSQIAGALQCRRLPSPAAEIKDSRIDDNGRMSSALQSVDPLGDSARGLLRWEDRAWSLCVGAGITIDVLPSWRELSRRILEVAQGIRMTERHFDDLLKTTGWHFDAWIQAALNLWHAAGASTSEFASQLERILYSDLRLAAAAEGLELDLLYAFHNAALLKMSRRHELMTFLSTQYPRSSMLSVARFLVEVVKISRAPAAILTFNYDTLLQMVVRLAELSDDRTSATAFVRVTRPESWIRNKIPICHLHGSVIPAPELDDDSKRLSIDSREQLVAPEEAYTQMAASPSAWAQVTFLHYAQSTNLLVLGHSLSDPNLRRWLAWTHETDPRSRRARLRRIWLRTRPDSKADVTLIEQSVVHLGVGVAWLTSWSEVGAALRNLVGYPSLPAPTA